MVRDQTKPVRPGQGYWFKEPMVEYEGRNKKEFYLTYIGFEIMMALLVICSLFVGIINPNNKAIGIGIAVLFFIFFCCGPIDAYISYRRYVVMMERFENKKATRRKELAQEDAAEQMKDPDLIDEKII
jgi:hypothetical protein